MEGIVFDSAGLPLEGAWTHAAGGLLCERGQGIAAPEGAPTEVKA